jgi:DNA-binding response OmpR family regulator
MTKPFALIIEDHEDHTIIFNNAFSMVGFETEVVMDGAAARKRLNETVPTVVVLDLHLPKVSGQALLQQIRSDKRLANTRVIVITADEALAEGKIDGADLILIKPVGFSYLRSIAERFLSST